MTSHHFSPYTFWIIVISALCITTLFSLFTFLGNPFYTALSIDAIDCDNLPSSTDEIKVRGYFVVDESQDPAPSGALVQLTLERDTPKIFNCARVWLDTTELLFETNSNSFIAGNWPNATIGTPNIDLAPGMHYLLRVDVGIDGIDDIRGDVEIGMPRNVRAEFASSNLEISYQDIVGDTSLSSYHVIVTDNTDMTDNGDGRYAEKDLEGVLSGSISDIFTLPAGDVYYIWVTTRLSGTILGSVHPDSLLQSYGYGDIVEVVAP